MSGSKILIDTNVFIGLEDQREVAPDFAKMVQLCGQHKVRVFVHEAAVDDIKRDRDDARRKISLSKIKKFEQLTKITRPPIADLVAHFGSISKPNDKVDVALLHALSIEVVDFLITQDQGIHARALRCSPPLYDRVLTVADAVAWLSATFEPKEVRLPFIEELPAHAIPPTDDIFESLRDGYPGFDKWWREKCLPNHRPCWVVTIDAELAALVVRKEETHSEAGTHHVGPRILKICTFKVKPKFRGEKLGELLLKQILWFAQKNSYDLVYLTTFPDQVFLIHVLEYFGFCTEGTNSQGEEVYEKPLSQDLLEQEEGSDLFDLARLNYPRFVARPPAKSFCVPIRSEYHEMLFPEMAQHVQEDLFGPTLDGGAPRIPGNTIRKVYLCRARTHELAPGAVLLFYCSKSRGYLASQTVTSVGVVEAVTDARSFDELVRLTAKRSVYNTGQLQDFGASASKPVKVIDFLLVGHFNPAITHGDLIHEGVFNYQPPQSICYLSPERFDPVRRRMNFGFDV